MRETTATPSRFAIVLACGLGLSLVLVALFLALGLRGNLAFVLSLRTYQLLAIIQTAAAVAVATVVFQTIAANRIVSPSIMGIDALYVLGQTCLVVLLGGSGIAALGAPAKFGLEIALLMLLALAVFLPLLARGADILLTLMTGVVLALLFRSLNAMLSRLIDPNTFAVAQGASHASFQGLDPRLVITGAVVTAAGCAILWRLRHLLDVVALGRDGATALGVDFPKAVTGLLLLVCAMTAVATALAGPLAFLGILVVAIAERLGGSRRHGQLLPLATLVAVIVLVGAQMLNRSSIGTFVTVGVVVEFFGGLVFLALLLSRGTR